MCIVLQCFRAIKQFLFVFQFVNFVHEIDNSLMLKISKIAGGVMVCITVNRNHLHKTFLQSSEPDIKFYFINLQTTRELWQLVLQIFVGGGAFVSYDWLV